MSNYNEELQSNNIDLQSILDSVNALPEAGGGTTVETCTVTISWENTYDYAIAYTSYNDDEINTVVINNKTSFENNELTSPISIENVIKNSYISITMTNLLPGFILSDTIELIDNGMVNIVQKTAYLQINGAGTIHIIDEDY